MYDVVIVGAGPAGLTAGYLLAKAGKKVVVLEADEKYVGGISRTVEYKDYRFDIGGHRFFSKSKQVEDFWAEILPNDMIDRPRKSRIFYRKKFFAYPLEPVNAFMTLGPIEAARCGTSFLYAKANPIENPKNFEEWVINQFGVRLYEIFFKHYTEKVWGMKCTDISADWAAQRIKGLSLGSAVWEAVKSQSGKAARRIQSRITGESATAKKGDNKAAVIKTLIEEFRYPRKGPGMLWEECVRKIEKMGGKVLMGHAVRGFEKTTSGWTVRAQHNGKALEFQSANVISSAPLREVMNALTPAASATARKAADDLRYRDFLTVALIVRGEDKFDDNWIYIQEPGYKVGRIQNFKSWSPEMVPDPNTSCYGLEYFCFEGDGIWDSPDEKLIELAKKEMGEMGLVDPAAVIDGHVVRQKKAYPVYDDSYAQNVDTVRAELESRYAGLHQIGRNGMHRYNNQDHAMMTAMLVAENILAGTAKWDPWRVNQDAEYIEAGAAGAEEKIASGGRMVPKKVPQQPNP